MQKFLLIEWAYPTSTNAKKLGKYNEGCYCVEVLEGDKIARIYIKKPFETAQDAINEAKKTGLQFHPLTLRFFASFI